MHQDMFLLGAPGSHLRQAVLRFAQQTGREVEYIGITRDTTAADLKQRREIVDGQLVFHNAPSVEAALKGRLLILEGLQKAERNVLPLLNNLLENREMSLEDGHLDWKIWMVGFSACFFHLFHVFHPFNSLSLLCLMDAVKTAGSFLMAPGREAEIQQAREGGRRETS